VKEAHYIHKMNLKGLMTVGTLCRKIGIGKTTYYRYENLFYPPARKIGKIRVFSRKDLERIKKAFHTQKKA
jgi:DNA-binding transcriptional MerR regulator